MNRLFLAFAVSILLLHASGNESNGTSINEKKVQEALKKAMEKEKKYAKEQKFYNADQYDFEGAKVDPEILKDIDTIEPDYNHTDDWGACDNE